VLRRALTALTASAALACLLAPAAPAFQPTHPDSAAPAGARPDWLPNETWVMERWMPFDEAQLTRVVGLNPDGVWLRINTGKTLDQIAAEQGVPLRGLATRLLANRRHAVSAGRYRVLHRRTARMLTQQHLAEHMLWHVFHQTSVLRKAAPTLGLSQNELVRRYFLQHQSIAAIATASGMSLNELRRRALAAAAASYARGVRGGAMSAAEARVLRGRDRHVVDAWLRFQGLGGAAQARAAARTPGLLCHLSAPAAASA
jgi:hypothetical protein